MPHSRNGVYPDGSGQALWTDGERIFCQGWRLGDDGERKAVLAVKPAAEQPSPQSLDRLTHEYGLKDELDGAWAARPVELISDGGRTVLVLEDHGGEPLERLLGAPMEMEHFLRLAIAIAAAVGKVHQRGLVHKDIKPANILVDGATGEVRLTGFGIASRLSRERRAAEPPEALAGTLAYMAPEQTGRMNRSIDSRSDLYALGVTFYQMLTGILPFSAADPMEWVHAHLARRPVAPADQIKAVPGAVSAIVMKLLAKTAEDRYQTAAGVESDFRGCLTEWEAHGGIDDFPLGEHDRSDRLLIPEKLYGRRREVESLLASFNRIVDGGVPELVLVSGYSGIGKSSVVNEMHKELVPPRGLFASGKFDRYKRDVPYATLAQAFQNLIRPLLSKSEAELSEWRAALHDALGANGKLIVNLVPELQLVIGEPPPVPELSLQEAQRRFQLVFRQFIGVFARQKHPLALFLDDLQWIDLATLDLIEDLLTQSDLRHLMLIGAYRDNEVDPYHPLMRKLDALRKAGAPVQEIVLAPLNRDDLAGLVTDSFHCESERAIALAKLIHEKTAGNAFFAIQFIYTLVEEGLIAFDCDEAQWTWDLDRVRIRGSTDNVADLMVGKLNRLPTETQQALQLLACMGDSADFPLLEMIYQRSSEEMHRELWEAVRAGFLLRPDHSYRFLHDRVREAAYSLIPEDVRGETHLRIGRLLVSRIPEVKREEAIFDVIAQFDRGAELITSRDEREQVAELYLIAGKRAKASAAYASALRYLVSGAALLPENCWERRHDLVFQLELHRSECELLTGNRDIADNRLMALSSRAATIAEQSAVECLRVDLYATLVWPDRAVGVCLDYLKRLGVEWSRHPTNEEAQREYDQVISRLGGREIEGFIELPLMSDPVSLAILDVLTKTLAPAAFTDANLLCLTACRMTNLSLQQGNSDGSCLGYTWFGMVARTRFGNHKDGVRFGRLGLELVEKKGLTRFQGRTYANFGQFIAFWTGHMRICCDLLQQAFEATNRIGDLVYAGYSVDRRGSLLVAAGFPLADVQREAERNLDICRATRYAALIDASIFRLGLVRTLRGLTPKFGSLDYDEFDEATFERQLAGGQQSVPIESWYWVTKLQARFHAGDYAGAVDASLEARRPTLFYPATYTETAEYHFYSALSHAAVVDLGDAEARERHLEALRAHHAQLEVWAAQCPENFENRAALGGAELARVEGRELEAERLYELAIRSARTNGFVNNEALGYELAARFYSARGFEEIAHLYLGNARQGYLRWGADRKVRQLDQLHPWLRQDERTPGPTSTIEAPVEHLDLATVIKVSQAVSSDIVLDKLLDTLLRTALAQAGAERGLLVLTHGAEPRIVAEATTRGDTVVVHLRDEPVVATALPESVVQYVLRTRESVLLDDAMAAPPFNADPYIRQHGARSVLGMPLLNQGQLIGALYLENNLTPRVFAPARIAVLKLIAAQAAISLENTRLYREVAEREAKIRRLVDSNIVGIFIWELEGRIIDANDAFLQTVGYDHEDLLSGRLRWTNLTPSEWLDRDVQRWVPELKMTGSLRPFETEYFRKDGSRVPILIGAATFEEGGSQGVAFVLDLTERRRVEAELQQARTELARVSRVTTLGELTAAIAHEINQPLSGVVNSGNACLRWLAAETPDLEAARRSVERIIDGGTRAGEIISRIRAMVKKSASHRDALSINDIIKEVLALVHTEFHRYSISPQVELSSDLPPVWGDRVQLQQVVLNLIMNAIEAMSGAGATERKLSLSSAKDGSDAVLVAVSDSGTGLDETSLDRLFDAFYTTKPDGMGMGLAVSQKIIQHHGGRLWATPNLPQGAIFQFRLPAGGGQTS